MKEQVHQAKQITIIDYLGSLGYFPQYKQGKEYFYFSPLRNEKTPSFAVNPQKNVFHDFGDNDKGDIIRLVMRLDDCSFAQALNKLLTFNGKPNKSFSFSGQMESIESKPSIIKVAYLQNSALLTYLTSRGVFPIAQRYCKEVYYSLQGKHYFSVGFPNDLGGYELRNAYMKNCLSPKSITTIQGTAQHKRVVNVFEGFIDFLSSLVYFNTKQPQSDTIVLNSLSQTEQALPILQGYEIVSLFLDNDQAGQTAVKTITQAHPQVINRADLYKDHKDFNEMIMSKQLSTK